MHRLGIAVYTRGEQRRYSARHSAPWRFFFSFSVEPRVPSAAVIDEKGKNQELDSRLDQLISEIVRERKNKGPAISCVVCCEGF